MIFVHQKVIAIGKRPAVKLSDLPFTSLSESPRPSLLPKLRSIAAEASSLALKEFQMPPVPKPTRQESNFAPGSKVVDTPNKTHQADTSRCHKSGVFLGLLVETLRCLDRKMFTVMESRWGILWPFFLL